MNVSYWIQPSKPSLPDQTQKKITGKIQCDTLKIEPHLENKPNKNTNPTQSVTLS